MHKRPIVAGLIALASLSAQAEIFKCTDAAGHVTYSNVSSKGCVKMNLEPIPSVPAAKPAPRAPTPASFPRVEEGTQKARDTDRRKILEQELATEQKSLDDVRKQLAEAEAPQPSDRVAGGGINQSRVDERLKPLRDQVQLHERNLEAIRKELQNLR